MELIEALLALEKQAAIVESFIPADADPALLVELLEPWAPPRRCKGNTAKVREHQLADWIAWLRDCGARWESRPAGDLEQDLVHLRSHLGR
jgi:hypothetical protein